MLTLWYSAEAGVVIFKDASANKGGVTSSSLEVLAALSLSDAEFQKHMTVQKNGAVSALLFKGLNKEEPGSSLYSKQEEIVPDFYKRYIEEVHRVIERNARLEFLAIFEGTWKQLCSQAYQINLNHFLI